MNATPAQIATLRALINESINVLPYDDATLGGWIDSRNGDVHAAAYDAWVSKSASLSSLVDISEGGSTRKNSQAYTNSLNMIKLFSPYVEGDVLIPGTGSRTRAIVRE